MGDEPVDALLGHGNGGDEGDENGRDHAHHTCALLLGIKGYQHNEEQGHAIENAQVERGGIGGEAAAQVRQPLWPIAEFGFEFGQARPEQVIAHVAGGDLGEEDGRVGYQYLILLNVPRQCFDDFAILVAGLEIHQLIHARRVAAQGLLDFADAFEKGGPIFGR